MLTERSIAIASSLLALAVAAVSATATRAQTALEPTSIPPIERSLTILRPEAYLRSNYSKRLDDLLEQINLGLVKGWLTPGQADELKRWHGDVAKEVELLRLAGGGIVRREDVDQLERHVNGLAYIVTRQINANARTAGTGKPPY